MQVVCPQERHSADALRLKGHPKLTPWWFLEGLLGCIKGKHWWRSRAKCKIKKIGKSISILMKQANGVKVKTNPMLECKLWRHPNASSSHFVSEEICTYFTKYCISDHDGFNSCSAKRSFDLRLHNSECCQNRLFIPSGSSWLALGITSQ